MQAGVGMKNKHLLLFISLILLLYPVIASGAWTPYDQRDDKLSPGYMGQFRQ